MAPDLECTFWPEGWWQHCCVHHDLGGSDAELFQCVVFTAPWPVLGLIVGAIMYAGVKLFRPLLLWMRRKH